jgi:hypothetical protein
VPTIFNGEELRERAAAVKWIARNVFTAAVSHLGEEEARRIFESTTRPPRSQKVRGAHDPDDDQDLLKQYDAEIAKAPERAKAAPRELAERRIKKDLPFRKEAVDTLAKRIRRLRDRREREQRRARFAAAAEVSFPVATILSIRRDK